MDKEQLNNPWKGLNFYTEGEILYGRNAEIQSLSQYIFNNTQTVLYGRSGIGKSSILNAGIFPKARLEGMTPVSIRLKHDDIDNYIWQIRAAIKSSGLKMKSILPAVDGHANEHYGSSYIVMNSIMKMGSHEYRFWYLTSLRKSSLFRRTRILKGSSSGSWGIFLMMLSLTMLQNMRRKFVRCSQKTKR